MRVNQCIMQNYVCILDGLQSFNGNKFRVSGTSTHYKHFSSFNLFWNKFIFGAVYQFLHDLLLLGIGRNRINNFYPL